MALEKGINSFITITESDAYFLDSLQNDSWIALSETTKSQALISAASQLNLKIDAAFKFPVADPSSINNFLSLANAQLALYFAITPDNVTSSGTGSNLKAGGAGSARVEFFRPVKGARFPTLVNDFLKESGTLSGSTSSLLGLSIATGTCDKSSFSDSKKYDKTEGFA